MRRIRDLVELAGLINSKLSEQEQKEAFCDFLLQDMRTLKGRDLSPYLSECFFDKSHGVEVLTFRFPMGAHIFNSCVGNLKSDGDNRDNTDM